MGTRMTTSDWRELQKKNSGSFSDECENQHQVNYTMLFQPYQEYASDPWFTQEAWEEMREIMKDVVCKICLKKGAHLCNNCPYRDFAPKGATIGPAASLLCYCCNEENGHPDDANWTGGYAAVKSCFTCGKYDDHWPDKCPEKDKVPDFFCGLSTPAD